ncbi:MAG: hypothetical protein EBR09_09830 [Proteobacteria bacterium]|nr:hypothetical protein [Pseudomonadota bacterium]
MNLPANAIQDGNQTDIPKWLLPVRDFVFGKQNERIEYFMDSYFKLPAEGRTGVIAGAFLFGGLTIFALIAMYLSALTGLQNQLDASFAAINTLRAKQVEYTVAKKRFDELKNRIGKITATVKMTSTIDGKIKSIGMEPENGRISRADKPSSEKDFIRSSPALSETYKTSRSEFRVNNISLKKIIDLVIAIESDESLLRVTDLRIKGIYGTKLFFESNFTVDGFELKQ